MKRRKKRRKKEKEKRKEIQRETGSPKPKCEPHLEMGVWRRARLSKGRRAEKMRRNRTREAYAFHPLSMTLNRNTACTRKNLIIMHDAQR